MEISFYNATVGAQQQQKRLDVISNNISNINTNGFKSQKSKFVDMLYSNIHAAPDEETDLTVGSSARIDKTDVDFRQGMTAASEGQFDFAIKGDGFFAVYDFDKKEIFYTRDGDFYLGDFGDNNTFYLLTQHGEFVLDANGEAIQVDTDNPDQDFNIGVYDFNNYQGMLTVGNNLFSPVAKNGNPFLNEKAEVLKGYLEKTNGNLADEMTDVILAQRTYQAQLRMISTSDEIEQSINNLR